MRVLLVHNRYRVRAGEDATFDQELGLLQNYGNEVKTWILDNQNIVPSNFLEQIQLAINSIWSVHTYKQICQEIQEFKPQIVHIHNILPLVSPTVYFACRDMGVPVVQTVQNYRLGCPAGTYFRSGKICERCQQFSLMESIRFGCYRNSRVQTTVVAAMIQFHRWLGTWHNLVDGYIAVSPFLKEKLVEMGIPAHKIFIKPNCIPVSNNYSPSNINREFGAYYLFAGRLVEEKGIRLLIQGYELSESKFPLLIAGTGELQDFVIEAAKHNPAIRYIGQQTREKILELMEKAIALIFPSLWYEGLPVSILEAYSCSLPVISTNIGAMSNMILPQKTGLLFAPTPEGLAQEIINLELEPQKWLSLKQSLPQYIDLGYFLDSNYKQLIEIYQCLIQDKSK